MLEKDNIQNEKTVTITWQANKFYLFKMINRREREKKNAYEKVQRNKNCNEESSEQNVG